MDIGSDLKKAWKSVKKTVNDVVGDKTYDAVGGSAAMLVNPGLAASKSGTQAGLKASGLLPEMPEIPAGEDPAAAAQRAADEATAMANQKQASRRRSIRSQSLLATGAQGVTSAAPTASLLAQGKATLGA